MRMKLIFASKHICNFKAEMNATDVRFHGGGEEIVFFKAL